MVYHQTICELFKDPDGTGCYSVMRHEGAHMSISLPFPKVLLRMIKPKYRI